MALDETDKKILRLLQEDAHYTLKDIANKINLSLTPVHDRVKRLEKEGVIEKYVTILNKKKLGNNLTVYCQVTLTKQTYDTSEGFNQSILNLPEVVECNYVSGNFDYMLKIIIPDMESYHRFHQQKLSVLPEVSLLNTVFVISEVKSTTVLPI
ncbi:MULTISPECIES: Lrp/AsnC family transcriptional regulator [Flavobacterium]|jgi:DNA-binding Lrp family transcriptional regulator|uniref:Lrp/AsnC family transcriptional regulator n=1 Tax=Flavobacterium cupriresistens TaxID=2893885 RepID=A0ABU4REM9_9FLAO|nr:MULTISPECIES: Lrp/AsnC family transcriptional regulator [unclassified Flavobacterium]KLT67850.1 AsnC family transcriptional regulator [Flavobacterium sp. ABG]MDX6191032.1 Lrp/AsnC family transcriptional regulator [Flavobacterium sp. Fl-318]UFH42647.1 Lrp/AsnC family transcriptional regulator [Flavobacterium sp. F-323]